MIPNGQFGIIIFEYKRLVMEFLGKMKLQYDLSDESVQSLLEKMEELSFAKGDIVVREGSRNDYVYIVKSGFVREYILRDGKVFTIKFAFDGDFADSYLRSLNEHTSNVTIEALDNSVLFRILRKDLDKLYYKSIELANWGRKLAEKDLLACGDFFLNYYWEDKGVQYYNIMKEYPQLLEKASLKDIASYLNITPQSLSRIRNKLKGTK